MHRAHVQHMDQTVADVRDLVQAYYDASEAVPERRARRGRSGWAPLKIRAARCAVSRARRSRWPWRVRGRRRVRIRRGEGLGSGWLPR